MHRANILFTDEVKFVKEMAGVSKAKKYGAEQEPDGQNKEFFLKKVVLTYQHRLRAAFVARRADEVQRRG